MGGLNALRRLRRAGLDDAQQELVRCLKSEARAQAAVDELDHAIARETESAILTADDARVEAFGIWLAEARRRAATIRADLDAAQAETHRSRAALTACRTALEIVQTLQRERAATAVANATRLQNHELDDIVRHSHDATRDGTGK